MSNKGGRVSPDYLADIAPEYAFSIIFEFEFAVFHTMMQLIQ